MKSSKLHSILCSFQYPGKQLQVGYSFIPTFPTVLFTNPSFTNPSSASKATVLTPLRRPACAVLQESESNSGSVLGPTPYDLATKKGHKMLVEKLSAASAAGPG